MKKRLTALAILVMSTIMISSCGNTVTFSCEQESENKVSIATEDAIAGTGAISGEFEIEEGDTVSIRSALGKGKIEIEFLDEDAVTDIDKLDINTEAVLTATVSDIDVQEHELPEGSYVIRSTVLEKSRGTVTIEVVEGE